MKGVDLQRGWRTEKRETVREKLKTVGSKVICWVKG